MIDYKVAAGNPCMKEIKSEIRKLLSAQDKERTVFLCFNYTYTLQKIYGVSEDTICQIHGTVDCSEESILFGHGDETEIENQLIHEVGSEYELGAQKRYLQKDTRKAIMEHSDFFDSLDQVRAVYSYDHVERLFCAFNICSYHSASFTWYPRFFSKSLNPGFFSTSQLFRYQIASPGFICFSISSR